MKQRETLLERAARRRDAADVVLCGPISQPTLKPQNKSLQTFQQWLYDQGIFIELYLLLQMFDVADALAEAFGLELFREGFPLYFYLSVVTSLQRLHPPIRRHLPAAWELATRWEAAEPHGHRTPLPLKIFRAL